MKAYALKALKQIEASAKNGIWEAHWGCAVLAGALLIEENLIDRDATASVTALLDKLMASHTSFQEEENGNQNLLPRELFAGKLLAELAPHAKEPAALGHDVIYSAYVLKALERFEIPPWESLLDAVILHIRQINAAGPGWITINGEQKIEPLEIAEEKTSADYWTIFSSFHRPLPMETGDMQLGHLLTHGHAIGMIPDHATPQLTNDFDLAYRKRLHALRLANEAQRDKSPLPRRKPDPRTKGYWALVESLGDMHGHAFKYAYSFLDLKRDHISAADLESYGRIVWPAASFKL
ncbi:MAG: hypothetical protein WCD79_21965 [Chthoniobacteraceae bacterium]